MTLFRHMTLLAALSAAPASAGGFQDLDALQARVVAALGADIGQPGGPAQPIDRRLKLAACPQPVSVEAPVLSAATVRCEALGWRIRVPVVSLTSAVRAAKAEPIVRKGDQVEVLAEGAAFSVSTLGIADQDGAPGDHIRVRSGTKAGAIIGEVGQDGRIFLPGFK